MSSVTTYDIGDTVRFSIQFRDATKTLADPSTVNLIVRQPGGAETTYGSTTKDGTGLYHQDVLLTKSGRWSWRWVGTGTVAAADEGHIYVETTGV